MSFIFRSFNLILFRKSFCLDMSFQGCFLLSCQFFSSSCLDFSLNLQSSLGLLSSSSLSCNLSLQSLPFLFSKLLGLLFLELSLQARSSQGSVPQVLLVFELLFQSCLSFNCSLVGQISLNSRSFQGLVFMPIIQIFSRRSMQQFVRQPVRLKFWIFQEHSRSQGLRDNQIKDDLRDIWRSVHLRRQLNKLYWKIQLNQKYNFDSRNYKRRKKDQQQQFKKIIIPSHPLNPLLISFISMIDVIVYIQYMSQKIIYWTILSQPARAVKTLVDIGKLPFILKNVNLGKGENKSKQYLQMYPQGKVPVLKDGDFVLGQSGAIMSYLCQSYEHLQVYYGKTIEQRAIVNQYVSWYQNYFRPFMVGPMGLYLRALNAKQPVQRQFKETSFKGMMECIQTLNGILAKNRTKFIAGSHPTIADFLIFHELTNAEYFDFDYQKCTEVKRWFGQVYRIPQVKSITHEWYQNSKRIKDLFKKVEVISPKL